MDYSVIKETLAKISFSDPSFLRINGLKQLSSAYDAYPVTVDNKKICILVPAGVKPKEASRMTEAAAIEKKIIVLTQEASKWVKAWPAAASSDGIAKPSEGAA